MAIPGKLALKVEYTLMRWRGPNRPLPCQKSLAEHRLRSAGSDGRPPFTTVTIGISFSEFSPE